VGPDKGLAEGAGKTVPLSHKENFDGRPHPIEVHRAYVLNVIQGDDGRYRLGIHDDGPGFESRRFAASVMARERPPPDPEMRSPAVGDGRANRNQKSEPQQDTTSAMRPQEFSTSWGAAS